MRVKWISFWLLLCWITCNKNVKLIWVTAKDFGPLPLTLFGFQAEQMTEHGIGHPGLLSLSQGIAIV